MGLDTGYPFAVLELDSQAWWHSAKGSGILWKGKQGVSIVPGLLQKTKADPLTYSEAKKNVGAILEQGWGIPWVRCILSMQEALGSMPASPKHPKVKVSVSACTPNNRAHNSSFGRVGEAVFLHSSRGVVFFLPHFLSVSRFLWPHGS